MRIVTRLSNVLSEKLVAHFVQCNTIVQCTQ